jgi:hypothetical protein
MTTDSQALIKEISLFSNYLMYIASIFKKAWPFFYLMRKVLKNTLHGKVIAKMEKLECQKEKPFT